MVESLEVTGEVSFRYFLATRRTFDFHVPSFRDHFAVSFPISFVLCTYSGSFLFNDFFWCHGYIIWGQKMLTCPTWLYSHVLTPWLSSDIQIAAEI